MKWFKRKHETQFMNPPTPSESWARFMDAVRPGETELESLAKAVERFTEWAKRDPRIAQMAYDVSMLLHSESMNAVARTL